MKEEISKVSKQITDKSSYSKEKSNKHGEVFTPNELIYEMISKLPRHMGRPL